MAGRCKARRDGVMPGVRPEFGVPADPEASILAARSEKGNSFYLTPPLREKDRGADGAVSSN